MEAANRGHFDTVNLLLEAGADTDVEDEVWEPFVHFTFTWIPQHGWRMGVQVLAICMLDSFVFVYFLAMSVLNIKRLWSLFVRPSVRPPSVTRHITFLSGYNIVDRGAADPLRYSTGRVKHAFHHHHTRSHHYCTVVHFTLLLRSKKWESIMVHGSVDHGTWIPHQTHTWYLIGQWTWAPVSRPRRETATFKTPSAHNQIPSWVCECEFPVASFLFIKSFFVTKRDMGEFHRQTCLIHWNPIH